MSHSSERWVIESDAECLNVKDLSPARLELAVKGRGPLYWNHQGLIAKVPHSVLVDAVRSWQDWKHQQARGRIPVIPPQIGEITTAQVFSPREPSEESRVARSLRRSLPPELHP